MISSAILVLSWLLLPQNGRSQTFPIQVTTVVAQASVYPEDLARPGALVVSVLLLDPNQRQPAGLPVRLAFEISDFTGRTLRVKQQAVLPMIDLLPNVPTVLTGARLRPYLEQLVAASARATILREGPLTVCVTAYAGTRLDLPAISSPSCGTAFAELHDPPSELTPNLDGFGGGPLGGQAQPLANSVDAVTFAWVPNHAGGVVDYELTVYEVPQTASGQDLGFGTDALLRSLAPLRTVRVPAGRTTYAWSLYDAPLEAGREYLYTVRAVDPFGRLRFRNRGLARPARFRYLPAPDPIVPLCYRPDRLTFFPRPVREERFFRQEEALAGKFGERRRAVAERRVRAAEKGGDVYRVTWTGAREVAGAEFADAAHTIVLRDYRGAALLTVDVPQGSGRLRVRKLRGVPNAYRHFGVYGIAGIYDNGYLYAFDVDLAKLVAAERHRRLDAAGIAYDDVALEATRLADSARAVSNAAAAKTGRYTPASVSRRLYPGGPGAGDFATDDIATTDSLAVALPNSIEASVALGLDTRMLLNRIARVEVCITCPLTGEVNCASRAVEAVEEAPTEACDLSGEILVDVEAVRATELDLRWRPRGRLRGDSIKVTHVPLDAAGEDAGEPIAVHLRTDARALTLRGLTADTDYRVDVCWHCAVPTDGVTAGGRAVVRRRCAAALRVRTAAFVCLDSLSLVELIDVRGLPADRIDVDFGELATVADASRLSITLVDSARKAPAARLDSAVLTAGATGRRYRGLPGGSEQAVRICYDCPPGASAPVRPAPVNATALDSTAFGATGVDPLRIDPLGTREVEADTAAGPGILAFGVPAPPALPARDTVAERHCATIPVRVPTCDEFDLAFEATGVSFDEAWLRWRYSGEDTVTLEVKPIARKDAEGKPVTFATGEADVRIVRTYLDAAGGSGGPNGGGLTRDGEFAIFALDSLVELTQYAVKVCGGCAGDEKCGWIEFWTPDISCKLDPVVSYGYACDPSFEFAPEVFGAERAPRLNVGDTIWAGDFLVQVVEATEVTGPAGTPTPVGAPAPASAATRADDPPPGAGPFFDGYGFVQLPMLGDAVVQLEFSQIEVTRTCRMVSGEMRMVSPVYTPGDLLDGFGADGGLAGAGDPGNATTVAGWLGGMSGLAGAYPGLGSAEWDTWLAGLQAGQANYATLPYYSEDVARAIQEAIACLTEVEAAYAEELEDLRREEGTGPQDTTITTLAPERTMYYETQAEACAAKLRAALQAAEAYEGLLYAAPYAVDFVLGTDAPASGDPEATSNDTDIIALDRQPAAAITEGYTEREIAGRPYRVAWISTAGGQPVDVTGFRASGYAGDGYASRAATPEGASTEITAGAKVLDARAGVVAGWRAADGTPIEGAGLNDAAPAIVSSLTATQIADARQLRRRREATVRVGVPNPDTGQLLAVRDADGIAVADSIDPRVPVPPIVFAGELGLVDYATPEERTVHLVGLDSIALATGGSGLTAATLERELNAIYAGAQVRWTVAVDAPLSVAELRADESAFTGRFADVGSAPLSAYSPEMRAVRRVLKRRAGGAKKGELYLVLAPALGGERLGFMPRGKGFGFVDVPRHGGDAVALARTIAHELGHGAFRFEHLDVRFKPDGYVGGATDNLMDGGVGRHLGKWQWDNAHDPEFNVAIFDDEDEGEATEDKMLAYRVNEESGRMNILTTAGRPLVEVASLAAKDFATEVETREVTKALAWLSRGNLYFNDGSVRQYPQFLRSAEQITIGNQVYEGVVVPSRNMGWRKGGQIISTKGIDQLEQALIKTDFKAIVQLKSALNWATELAPALDMVMYVKSVAEGNPDPFVIFPFGFVGDHLIGETAEVMDWMFEVELQKAISKGHISLLSFISTNQIARDYKMIEMNRKEAVKLGLREYDKLSELSKDISASDFNEELSYALINYTNEGLAEVRAILISE